MKTLFAILVSAFVAALSVGVMVNSIDAAMSAKGLWNSLKHAKRAVKDKFPIPQPNCPLPCLHNRRIESLLQLILPGKGNEPIRQMELQGSQGKILQGQTKNTANILSHMPSGS